MRYGSWSVPANEWLFATTKISADAVFSIEFRVSANASNTGHPFGIVFDK
jgi:hypothetical protein